VCGIVGVIGHSEAAPYVIEGLRRLEYRGYDSAGIATLANGVFDLRRAEGKLSALESLLAASPVKGVVGIGHTRWATHGAPNENNAHPHFSENVALVHNGIIENFRDLKEELVSEGFVFSTQTDTEVVAHLISKYLKQGVDVIEAAHRAIGRLEGAFALAIMIKDAEDTIIGRSEERRVGKECRSRWSPYH